MQFFKHISVHGDPHTCQVRVESLLNTIRTNGNTHDVCVRWEMETLWGDGECVWRCRRLQTRCCSGCWESAPCGRRIYSRRRFWRRWINRPTCTSTPTTTWNRTPAVTMWYSGQDSWIQIFACFGGGVSNVFYTQPAEAFPKIHKCVEKQQRQKAKLKLYVD